MKNNVILLLFSLAACLAIKSGLKAAELKQPSSKKRSGINERHIEGAVKIADAILTDKPRDVLAIFNDVYAIDLLAYQNPETSLKRARALTRVVVTFLTNMRGGTLMALDNKASKLFIAIQDRNICRLLIAQRQTKQGIKEPVIEQPGLGKFVKLPLHLIFEIAKYLPDNVLETLAKISSVFYPIARQIFKKRAVDLIKFYCKTIKIQAIPLEEHIFMIRSVALSADNQILSSGPDDNNNFKLKDMKTGNQIILLGNNTNAVIQ